MGKYYIIAKKRVDFYLQDTGIEVKWQKTVDNRDFHGKFKNNILLSKTDFKFLEEQNLIILPAAVLLLL